MTLSHAPETPVPERPINERTILVTGSTDGMGRALALELLRRGATVLLHGRDRQRLDAVLAEADRVGAGRAWGYVADYASLAEVERFAQELTRDHDHLECLVNNAGIGSGPADNRVRDVSADGYELRFAVNYLAPVLLTERLRPLLVASAPARIVNVASVGQRPIDFTDPLFERGYDALAAYAKSKLALIMFTADLAAELEGTGVVANSLHPASLMNTKMAFETFGRAMTTIEDGVAATAHLAVDRDTAVVNGSYFDGLTPGHPDPMAGDARAREQLRELTRDLIDRALTPSPR